MPAGSQKPGPEIAVLVPCYNEEATIAQVVADFRSSLPGATIYVYDNNSSDRTVEVARAAGAVVRREPQQGKGHVIRRMFADLDADVYLMVDGDDTYDAAAAPKLVETLINNTLDMVNGRRVGGGAAAYRAGHRFGNWLLTSLVTTSFGARTSDMLSGYRAFSRRFVKTFPTLSAGFEIETELTVHALELRMPIMDVDTRYKERPAGSLSKLSTYRDGARILAVIARLVKDGRPLEFFWGIGVLLAMTSLVAGYPVVTEYLETGLVPRFPTAILASALMILAVLSATCGVILVTVTQGRREMKRLLYLQQPSLERFRDS